MKKNNKILLDASAIIALIQKETGYKEVDDILPISSISTVNFAELVTSLVKKNVTTEDIDIIIDNIIPEIIPFSHEVSIKTGKLLSLTKPYGLSLGDRACIATALHHNKEIIYTADKAWANLDIPNLKIHLIR